MLFYLPTLQIDNQIIQKNKIKKNHNLNSDFG